jgi:membrane protein implicated in regulation of membrane protease activity
VVISINLLAPFQHPILTPSTPTRRIAQSLNLQHVTGIIIRPSTRQIRTIESDGADWLAEAQDRDIRKRIRVFV